MTGLNDSLDGDSAQIDVGKSPRRGQDFRRIQRIWLSGYPRACREWRHGQHLLGDDVPIPSDSGQSGHLSLTLFRGLLHTGRTFRTNYEQGCPVRDQSAMVRRCGISKMDQILEVSDIEISK